MQNTKLDLDSRKLQSQHRQVSHVQTIHKPRKEEQPETTIKTGTKRHTSNANIGTISDGANDVKPKSSRKREDKGSDKENQTGLSTSTAMKNAILIEDDDEEDVLRLPDDSSDDDSPSRFSADMTKTSFGSKNIKLSQTSASSVPSRKITTKEIADSKPITSLKRKNEESDSRHDPEVDQFGNMQSKDQKLKSYIQEHKFPKPGANSSISRKKPYGRKKTTTYGKKLSPAKVFQTYSRDSSPSLVSDDGKEKLQDYTIDTPTKIQSPIKGGFVRPDFSDDDFSDLDLPSNLQQSNCAPPSTQFKRLQRYDDDDDDDMIDEVKELVKKQNGDAVIDIQDFEEEDSSSLDDYTGSRCPMCNEPVAAEDLEAFGKMNTWKQEKFCVFHQRKNARSDWKAKGYPDIDWVALDSRVTCHHAFIKKIIGGASCHSRSRLAERVRAGKDRNLMHSTTNLIPGYYGSRGLRLMSENIMNKFTPKLKQRAPIDRLIAARGPAAFVESVVVPELTVLLIKEDMNVQDEEAREILKESCEMGDLVNEEVSDVVKLTPKKKPFNDSDVSHDEENDFDF